MIQKNTANDIILGENYIDKNTIHYMICDGLQKTSKIIPVLSGLYTWGDTSLLSQSSLSIVGPRKMSGYGKRVLDILFPLLQQYNVVTVSGGAYGTDEYVHTLSLRYNIPTIVVLGGGIGRYQHTGKVHFLENIVKHGGLIISEYEHLIPPQKYTFPQRNRIIAGLGDTLFLPEAGLASGSLITVNKAVQYEVPVYAPMQDIFSYTGEGIAEYIVNGKILPLSGDLGVFLSKYYSRKTGETKLLTVNNIPKSYAKTKKRELSSSSSISGNLIEESLRELGL